MQGFLPKGSSFQNQSDAARIFYNSEAFKMKVGVIAPEGARMKLRRTLSASSLT